MSKMLYEIREQPAALERTLLAELGPIEEFKKSLRGRRIRSIILTARGSSDNAAQFGRYLLEITTGLSVSLAAPSVITLYGGSMELAGVLVIGISQSGESTDTNALMEHARKQGGVTVGITNDASSTLARVSEFTFITHAGTEQSIAATKTYTGQQLLFYLIAYALSGAVSLDSLRRLPEWTEAALTMEKAVRQCTEEFEHLDRTIVVARGFNYGNAMEFALKLMETCQVVAERFSAADLLHGPIAVTDRSFPVFFFAPKGPTWPSIERVLDQLRLTGVETIVITDAGHEAAMARSPRMMLPVDLSLDDVRWGDLYTPIPYIVPAQLFAAYLSERKGLNPDQPRGLSKVTLTI